MGRVMGRANLSSWLGRVLEHAGLTCGLLALGYALLAPFAELKLHLQRVGPGLLARLQLLWLGLLGWRLKLL